MENYRWSIRMDVLQCLGEKYEGYKKIKAK